jgi:general stress protein 26
MGEESTVELMKKVRELLGAQKVGVLATEYEGQPYASLVAFAATPDLGSLLFATERSTRKYMNMSVNPKATLLVDNRNEGLADVDAALAAAAMGKVEEARGKDWGELSEIYLEKNPDFSGFLESAALMRLQVDNYIVVRGLRSITVVEMR